MYICKRIGFNQYRQTAKTAICRFKLEGSETTIKTTSGGIGGLAVLAEIGGYVIA